MSYKIECTIQEIELDISGKITGLKILGTEGYSLKQGEETYNVFRPEAMPKEGDAPVSILVLNPKTILKAGLAVDSLAFLVQAKCAGRKVRLEIEADARSTGNCFVFKDVKISKIGVL